MASLSRRASGLFLITFSFAGWRHCRSLETDNEKAANNLKAKIEDTIRYVRQGVVRYPDELLLTADQSWKWLLSGGKITEAHKVSRAIGLAAFTEDFLASFPEGGSASIGTMRCHLKSFQRILGAKKPIQEIKTSDLRRWMTERLQQKGLRAKTISSATIKKEVATFRQMWEFAKNEKLVAGENPSEGLRMPRSEQAAPFKTWEQCEKLVKKTDEPHEQAEIWDCLFLREQEIIDLLQYVKMTATEDYAYPFFAFVAMTGCRRSEAMRSELEDISDMVINLREKKRCHDKSLSFRQVGLHPLLETILTEWSESHPGGSYTFCKADCKPLTPKEADGIWKRTLRGSKWSVVPGYHCLRHSFASILAMQGEQQGVIDGMMGHQTEEMRLRYRHLFPEQRRSAMLSIFKGRQA